MAGLDLERLQRIRLMRRPVGQVVVASVGLALDYRFPRRTEIRLEGTENLPRDRAVFFAMNHTDRYNYWPFQYELYQQRLGYTATWVKGKYYENRWMGHFMDSMNNIPVPSRGYVIATRFLAAMGRTPSRDEYRVMRDLVDRKREPEEVLRGATSDVRRFLADPANSLIELERNFDLMIHEVVRLNRRAVFELGLHVLVFPEGTRGKRLGVGRIGLAQMALHLGVDIVPVGCNGSDRLYPGNSPFSKGGRAVYRIGEPMRLDERAFDDCRVPASAVPMSFEAAERYGARYQRLTDRVMDRIELLLDPEYRRAEGDRFEESGGAERFVT